MKSELRQKHVDSHRLIHAIIPGDNVVGELQGWDGEFLKLKNPKRLAKSQGVIPGKGAVISISLIDWDMVDEGIINLKPIAYFLIRDMNEATQKRYFGIYLGHLQDKIIQSAKNAGIEIAGMNQLPKDVRHIG